MKGKFLRHYQDIVITQDSSTYLVHKLFSKSYCQHTQSPKTLFRESLPKSSLLPKPISRRDQGLKIDQQITDEYVTQNNHIDTSTFQVPISY